jgi:hypothetical protein
LSSIPSDEDMWEEALDSTTQGEAPCINLKRQRQCVPVREHSPETLAGARRLSAAMLTSRGTRLAAWPPGDRRTHSPDGMGGPL